MWTMAGPHHRCPLNLAFSAPSRGWALHLVPRGAYGSPPPSGLWSLEAGLAVFTQGPDFFFFVFNFYPLVWKPYENIF